ncbi:hypothetical protein DPEC_G00148670 [Dallia pectoralis]|uniref:Uncharacterized protein n=1 Tax=Dallia pectoralis TaxID=75939 RepID=A0ACC2GIT4_DALPE|nr:hypothetical protein DPEC_G00148670 [Dallia pectoralis]
MSFECHTFVVKKNPTKQKREERKSSQEVLELESRCRRVSDEPGHTPSADSKVHIDRQQATHRQTASYTSTDSKLHIDRQEATHRQTASYTSTDSKLHIDRHCPLGNS